MNDRFHKNLSVTYLFLKATKSSFLAYACKSSFFAFLGSVILGDTQKHEGDFEKITNLNSWFGEKTLCSHNKGNK